LILNVRNSPIAVYDATKTYAVGDVVWYDKNYYICNTAITTAEAWTAGHWSLRNPSGAILSESSIIPWANNTYTLGNSSYKWSTIFTGILDSTATSMRHLDAGKNEIHTDHSLYIGYGSRTFTSKTLFYYSTGTTDTVSSRT